MASRIDYRLRPAKHVERKLLCETFRRLNEFGALETYRYMGFGSFYFADFSLFHKALGITNMLSMEKDAINKPRFDFNKPFKCITVDYRESNEVLPTLPWDLRTILWLDYDDPLTKSMLTDVNFFCSNAIPGSVLVVTVNAQSMPLDQKPLENLKERVGKGKAAFVVNDIDLAGWGTAIACRRIILNEIAECLIDRNGGRPEGSRFVFRQLFNFHYADGAKMLTVGGLLYDEGQSAIVAKCAFDNLRGVRPGEDPCLIETPRLTFREMRHLDSQLPVNDYTVLNSEGIPKEDLERYSRFYQYFPNYAEADL